MSADHVKKIISALKLGRKEEVSFLSFSANVAQILGSIDSIPRGPLDELGNTALHLAAGNNHLKLTRALLKSGWSPFDRNKLNQTPYEYALRFNYAYALSFFPDKLEK
jgi:ankyrin repeat protein